MRRTYGTVEQRNGRFRARTRVNGKLETIGTFRTAEEAEAALVLFSEHHSERLPLVGETLRSWGRKWLDARETDGVHRSVDRDRYVWRRIQKAAFIDIPLMAITAREIREWIALQLRTTVEHTGKTPSRQTVVNALNLLRVSLESACQGGLLDKNPALGIRVPRIARTRDAWTWLRTEEIARLLGESVPDEPRDLFAFAIYTGLRAGEIFGLCWEDIDWSRKVALIRHSWQGTATKRGETREVHLFAPALDALKRQRERVKQSAYVFPAIDGEARSRNYKPRLHCWLERAGVKRHARFHDLRHTCASHLISGSWGRAWTLEEVARHLGHSSSAVTRRYAHLCPEGLQRAVRETRPELHARLLAIPPSPVPTEVPTSSQRARPRATGHAMKPLNLAEEKGFEPLNPLRGRRFSKPGESSVAAVGSEQMGTFREHAVELLRRMQQGTCTSGDVARLAADVLANPSPLIAAAQRFLRVVGGEHEGSAAVELLWVLIEGGAAETCRAESG